MAKKKATDTKGLAGIPVYGSNIKTGKDIRLNKKVKPKKVNGIINYLGDTETVTVPKQWLSSPDHVVAELAYITPAEQKILLDANLYGSLNGKPNRGPGGLMSLQGGGEQEAKDAGASNTSQASPTSGFDDSAEFTGYSPSNNQSSSSSSSSSGTDISYEGEDDYDPYEGTGKTAADKFGYTADKADDLSKSGFQTRGFGGLSRSDYADLRDRAAGGESYAQKALEAYEKGLSGELAGAAGGFYKDARGNIRGHTTLQKSFLPDKVNELLGLPSYYETYRGRANLDPFNQPTSDDGGQSGLASVAGGSGTLQAGEVETPAVTPDDYYQRGVGTQTIDLADAAQRDAFIAGLYGTTPSPIGSRLDREKGLLYLPDGTVVDIKTGKKIKEPRISGLDIFKPLQTYTPVNYKPLQK